jgi:hypothetical protein
LEKPFDRERMPEAGVVAHAFIIAFWDWVESSKTRVVNDVQAYSSFSCDATLGLPLRLPELCSGLSHGVDVVIGHHHGFAARLADQEMLFDIRHFPGREFAQTVFLGDFFVEVPANFR